jgi:choline kinase
MQPTLLILAAGMGSRYGGLKQVDPVGPSGETIMDYSVFDAIRAGFGKIVFVIRKDIEKEFREIILPKYEGKIPIEFAFQEIDSLPEGFTFPADRAKPWGTGHAVLVAKDVVKEAFAVINADDFYGPEAFETISEFLQQNTADDHFAMVGYALKNTLSDYGDVSRGICKTNDNGLLESVTERSKILSIGGWPAYMDEDGKATYIPPAVIVSMNFWGFMPSGFAMMDKLFRQFLSERSQDPKSEFYLSSAIDELIKRGQVKVSVLQSPAQWFGVTYKEDKPLVVARIQDMVKNGIYPEALWP